MFYVYILYNDIVDKYYIGYTSDLSKRLEKHNRKGSPYTSRVKGEWALVYCEPFNNKNKALLRERQIKKYKSRKYIEELANKNNG